MNKSYIVKYIIGWMIISYIINFFIGGNKPTPLRSSAVVRLVKDNLISQKPIQFDLSLFQTPLYKNNINDMIKNQSKGEDKIIFFNTPSKTYEYYFSEHFAAPVKLMYTSLSDKPMTIFDISQSTDMVIPSLTVTINGKILSHFEFDSQDGQTIVFKTCYGQGTITKSFTYNHEGLTCQIHFQNCQEENITTVQLIGLQNKSSFLNNKNEGVFANTDQEGIVKLLPSNEESFDTTVVLDPNNVGAQSEYTLDSVIAKTKIDRAYYSQDNQNNVYFYCDYKVDQTNPDYMISYDWYSGVKNINTLNKIDKKLAMVMEYGFILKIASSLLGFILWITSFIKSFGLAFLIFIILTKLIFIPFLGSFKKYHKKNKELQQKLEYIKVKYHNNPEMKKQEEMLAYQKYGFASYFISAIPQLFNLFIFMSLQSIMRKNVLLYKMPIGLWLSDAMMPDQYYVLPIIFFIMLCLTINNMKQISPMIKIALIFGATILVYFYSYWSSAMQLFVLAGLIVNYIENKFFAIK